MTLLTRIDRDGGRPSYDRRQHVLNIPVGCTPYELAHERAHEWQDRAQTRLWRLDHYCYCVPYVGRLARLAVEWQASRMALEALRQTGFSCEAMRTARREARAGLWSYVRALCWL